MERKIVNFRKSMPAREYELMIKVDCMKHFFASDAPFTCAMSELLLQHTDV
jgi:hypothetical protein